MTESLLLTVGIYYMDFRSYNVLFRRGDVVEFAVEAWVYEDRELVSIEPAAGLAPSRAPTDRLSWQVITGRSLYTWTGLMPIEGYEQVLSVIDIGVPVFVEDYAYAPSTWVRGEALIWVDPDPYVFYYAGIDGIPPLVHTWRIERIQNQVDRGLFDIEAAPLTWVPGQRDRDYLLTVRLLDVPPPVRESDDVGVQLGEQGYFATK